ncbi:11733_t:CDS:2 [Racocetra persica]|uniref:11733_t:CDS:1 n=1 Tax=Racocetra persica TaxID=160502 RepID=A0ACA9LIN9_9GLOM|nr:11733_t:CDS:2 [Racocetra persica]
MLVAKYEPHDNDLSEELFGFQSNDELILSDKICTQVLKGYYNTDLGQQLLNHLEKRWQSWKQPLLILSFVLYPNYQIEKVNAALKTLTWFQKVLAICQLRRILTQKYRIQELDKLKRLYESTSAPSFLDDFHNIPSTSSIFQNTETEIDNSKNENTDDDKDTMKLWLLALNKNNSDSNKDNLNKDEESNNTLRLDCDLNKLLNDQEHLVKDKKAKWPLNNLFSVNLETPFFVANI